MPDKPMQFKQIGGIVAMYGLLPAAIAAALTWVDIPRGLTSRETIFALATGLFAVVGFLATARSFLVIKLHESIYGTDEYINRVRSIDGEHASVYNGLLVFDKSMGGCIITGVVSMVLLWVAAFAQSGLFAVEAAFAYVIIAMIRFFRLAWLMNVNFQAMITEWDHTAKTRMAAMRETGNPDVCAIKKTCPFYRQPAHPGA